MIWYKLYLECKNSQEAVHAQVAWQPAYPTNQKELDVKTKTLILCRCSQLTSSILETNLDWSNGHWSSTNLMLQTQPKVSEIVLYVLLYVIKYQWRSLNIVLYYSHWVVVLFVSGILWYTLTTCIRNSPFNQCKSTWVMISLMWQCCVWWRQLVNICMRLIPEGS
jgi:hypothetical protein